MDIHAAGVSRIARFPPARPLAFSIDPRSGIKARMSNFNGVKVLSATMFADRDQLGEKVTAWLSNNKHLKIDDIVVTQSSDASFHCIAVTIFYKEERR
jgi:hypothetical protein